MRSFTFKTQQFDFSYDDMDFDFKWGYSNCHNASSFASNEEHTKSEQRETNDHASTIRREDSSVLTSHYSKHNQFVHKTDFPTGTSHQEESSTLPFTKSPPYPHQRCDNTALNEDSSDVKLAADSKIEKGYYLSSYHEETCLKNDDWPSSAYHFTAPSNLCNLPQEHGSSFQNHQENPYNELNIGKEQSRWGNGNSLKQNQYHSYRKPVDECLLASNIDANSYDFVESNEHHRPLIDNGIEDDFQWQVPERHCIDNTSSLSKPCNRTGEYKYLHDPEIVDIRCTYKPWNSEQHFSSSIEQLNLPNHSKRKRDTTSFWNDNQYDCERKVQRTHSWKDVRFYERPAQNPLKPKKKRRVKKAKGEPRRYLSAYNFFFKEERERILALLPCSMQDEQYLEGGANISDTCSKITEDRNDNIHSSPSAGAKVPVDQMDLDQLQTYLLSLEERMSKKENDELEGRIRAKSLALLAVHTEGERTKNPHTKRHGKIAMVTLSKLIGMRWRELVSSCANRKQYYYELATKDQNRYRQQMDEIWRSAGTKSSIID